MARVPYSAKYPATRTGVKRGLRVLRISQALGAKAIGKSEALVSLVLAGKVVSQPCLDKLAAYIAAQQQARRNGDTAA